MIMRPKCKTRRCKHYIGIKKLSDESTEAVAYCRAFPDGIPDEIAYGDDLHVEPFPGDGGIIFEPLPITP